MPLSSWTGRTIPTFLLKPDWSLLSISPISSTLLSFSQKWLCSLFPRIPTVCCRSGQLPLLCPFLPFCHQAPRITSPWGVTSQTTFLVTFCSLKPHTHEAKGFHASLIDVLVCCWKVLLFYKCCNNSIKLSFFHFSRQDYLMDKQTTCCAVSLC